MRNFTISGHPSNQTVVDGQTATFTASVDRGSGVNVNYQWYKGGVAVQGATNATYSFAASRSDHNDTVYVRVSNGTGAINSNSARVYVQYQPVVGNLSPQTVGVGQTISFNYSRTGNPATYTYQWQKDGANIPGATNRSLGITADANSGGS